MPTITEMGVESQDETELQQRKEKKIYAKYFDLDLGQSGTNRVL